MIRVLLLTFFSFFTTFVLAQDCTTLGQTPSSAFPVCGTSTFQQNTVPICSTVNLFVPGCSGSGGADYENKNPFWYIFTCFQSGTLGFVINPNNPGDDYDWQLYDITGRNPMEVYTNNSLVVTGNWSGSYGPTGASSSGVNFIQCASNPNAGAPTFAQMPNIIQGHQYLLLVSHFTDSQSGYSLSFNGGTASITDPLLPKTELSTALCDGSSITVKLNKKMKCSSLTGTGSEFYLVPASATVVSATGVGCSNRFDMNTVTLTLSNPLPPGDYQIKIRRGSDGNTLLDNCDRELIEGDSVSLAIAPVTPTRMDSLTKPGCSPQVLELVFKKQIRCSSVNPDGSDFLITGTYPVTITGATGDCSTGLSSKIYLQLSQPLQRAGNFKLKLRSSLDGTTIIDECGQETPVGDSILFSIKDTVNARFANSIFLGCVYDTVNYSHNGANGVNSWSWTFDDGTTSSLQNPIKYYTVFGYRETSLIVSNGTCSDTASKRIFLRNTLKAGFEATELLCPNDPATFKDTTIGNIIRWSWDFGNGNSSSMQNPPQQSYLPSLSNINYEVPVRLIVEDDIGCQDTAVKKIFVIWNCYITVPSAFTPNGDGLNDNLYPLNAYKAKNLKFAVYNRLGELVFYSENWTRRWNGKYKGQDADPGAYVWILIYKDGDSGKLVQRKGSTLLIR
jgi:gliding motility-associated-like protein